jgi:TetR/AcrR family transcriptional repressor of nem operon
MTAAEPRLTAPGRRTRERIVETAAGLMFHQGVAGTSIPDIQQAAGVSASQIYHYFKDKQGLVRAVIEYRTEQALVHQRPLLETVDSLDDLRAWSDAAVAIQDGRACAGGCEVGSLASELAESCPETRVALAASFERWEEPIRAGLVRLRERGELRADADPHDLATVLLAALQGGLLLTQVRRTSHPLRTALDGALAYIATFAP